MKLKSILVIAFCFVGTVLLGQGDDYVLDKDSIKVKDRLHYNFTMGAGFGYSSNAKEYFAVYYSPSVIYDVSSRFSIKAGFTHINSTANDFPVYSDYSYTLFNGNISQYYTYVGGVYKVNDRLKIGGSVFYDFTNYEDFQGNSYGDRDVLSNIGYSGFFEYKITDGMSIMGEIRVNDKNPMGNRIFGSYGQSFTGR